MQRHSFLVWLIAGLFVVATSGIVLAEESNWQSGVSGTEQMSTPESPSQGYEEPSSQEYQGPVETGSTVQTSPDAAEWNENDPNEPGHEIIRDFGGVKFRDGIDGNP